MFLLYTNKGIKSPLNIKVYFFCIFISYKQITKKIQVKKTIKDPLKKNVLILILINAKNIQILMIVLKYKKKYNKKNLLFKRELLTFF